MTHFLLQKSRLEAVEFYLQTLQYVINNGDQQASAPAHGLRWLTSLGELLRALKVDMKSGKESVYTVRFDSFNRYVVLTFISHDFRSVSWMHS